jgi:hypothetical protein
MLGLPVSDQLRSTDSTASAAAAGADRRGEACKMARTVTYTVRTYARSTNGEIMAEPGDTYDDRTVALRAAYRAMDRGKDGVVVIKTSGDPLTGIFDDAETILRAGNCESRR